MSILLLNGPNLNLLGTREPEIYGATTLADLEAGMVKQSKLKGIELICFQSNIEGELINKLHELRDSCDYLIINPGAFTHTSVAIRDAILGINVPFIEVHISNVFAREAFRHHSFFSDIAVGTICGLGINGYYYALESAIDHIKSKQ